MTFNVPLFSFTDKRDRRGERDAEHRTNPKNHDRIRDHRGTYHIQLMDHE